MSLTVRNHTPAYLKPWYKQKPTGDFDLNEVLNTHLIPSLLKPLNQNAPVDITENNNPVTHDTIINAFIATMGENVDPDAEESIKELLKATMLYYEPAGLVSQLYPMQAAAKHQLPLPSDHIIYTINDDIIPTCKQFLARQTDEDLLLASFAFYAQVKTLGVWCQTEQDFIDFKAYIKNQLASLQSMSNMPPNTLSSLTDFLKLDLKEHTQSLILRSNHDSGLEELSFARVITWLTFNYIRESRDQSAANNAEPTIGIMPFHLKELYIPTTLTFINIDVHAHSSAKAIADEWNILKSAFKQPLKLVNKGQINKLGATQRHIQKMQQQMAAWGSSGVIGKSLERKFSPTRPTQKAFISMVKSRLQKMGQVNMSMNMMQTKGQSFLKANRRDPLNPSLMGTVTNTKYLPDIHLYVDTSGSISEEQYEAAVKGCIALAKSMGVDLYYNSFSHYISGVSKINVKGKSVASIHNSFRKIPTVTGGTDFANVWEYIERSPKRKKEFSLMITDFEWCAPNAPSLKHPKNLYYTACDGVQWDWILEDAERFSKSCKHLDPMIRSKLLI